MRNFIAITTGAITSFLLMVAIAFLLMRFDIKPFSDFAKGTMTNSQILLASQKVVYLYSLVLFPVIAFLVGIVSAFIAKNKEYLIGLLCAVPMFIIFFNLSFAYLLMIFAASVLLFVGVRVAVYIKKKRRAHLGK